MIAQWAIFETQVTAEQVVLLSVMGLALGIISGLFGVGGGFLSTPLLRILFGASYPLAVGSTLVYVLGTSAAGTVAHHRRGHIKLKAVALIGIGGAVGVLFGDILLHVLEDRFGRHHTSIMHCLYIALLVVIAWRVARDGRSRSNRLSHQAALVRGVPPAFGPNAPALVSLGACGGMLTGALGIGGGILFVPVLILAVGYTVHQAVGTSLGVLVVGAAVGVGLKGWRGEVDMGVGMSLLIGSSIGAQIGVRICHALNAQRLKQYFAVLVLLAAILVAADLIRRLA